MLKEKVTSLILAKHQGHEGGKTLLLKNKQVPQGAKQEILNEKIMSLLLVKHRVHKGGKTMITTSQIEQEIAMLLFLKMWSSSLHTR